MKDCPLRQVCYGQRLWLIQVLGGNAYSQNHHRAVSVGHSCAFPGFFLEPLSWNGIQSGSGRGQCELSSPCPTVAFFYVENLSESLALWSVSEGAVSEACAIDPYSMFGVQFYFILDLWYSFPSQPGWKRGIWCGDRHEGHWNAKYLHRTTKQVPAFLSKLQ